MQVEMNTANKVASTALPKWPSVTAGVMHQWLQCLDVKIPLNKLQEACSRADRLPDQQPAVRLRALLTELHLSWLLPSSVAWERFDTTALPALVLHQGSWKLAQKSDRGDPMDVIALIDQGGVIKEVKPDDLIGHAVLWLRRSRMVHARGEQGQRKRQALGWLLKELFRSPSWLFNVMASTVLINLLAVATSLFAMQVYDRVVPTLAYSTLTTLVVGMVLVVLFDWVLKVLRGKAMDHMGVQVDKVLSQRVFDHLLHLRLDLMPKGVGQLTAQVNGMESVRNFLSSSVIYALIDLPFVLMFIVFIAIIGGPLAWVYASLLPLAFVFAGVSHWRQRHITRQLMHQVNERTGVLVDAIRGAESIRAANAMHRFSQEWQHTSDQMAEKSRQQKANQTVTLTNIQALSTLAYVAALVVGVSQIESGHLSMGALIACSILGGRVIGPVAQGVQLLSQWYNVSRSLEQVDDILTIEQERRPGQQLLVTDAPPDHIELDKVSFSYAGTPVKQLRIEHLELHAGDRVLLLGPIGGGKSTLMKVLAGLYRPTEGRVRVGPMDLWEMDPDAVANMISYLPQQVHLFKGTLRSNLATAGVRDDLRMAKATQLLGIDVIANDSPQGMDSPVSEGGEGLSGGQRQLIGLARVVVAAPRVWLLDEPTAALDTKTEAQVWQALAHFVAPQDILVVATHRPMAAMSMVNRVLMLQKGVVVKDGKPSEVTPQLAQGYQQQAQVRAQAHAARVAGIGPGGPGRTSDRGIKMPMAGSSEAGIDVEA